MRHSSAPTDWSALSCFWAPLWIGSCETRNAEVETRNRRAGAGRACSAFCVSRSAFTPAPPPPPPSQTLSPPQSPPGPMNKRSEKRRGGEEGEVRAGTRELKKKELR